MNEITFSTKQLNAIDTIVKFALNKDTKNIAITLTGSAGTGKTTIVKEIRNRLMQQGHNVILLAPTNKARIILQTACNALKSYTIHSFLGLKPITQIANYDANNIMFVDEDDIKETSGLVIIDECSMIEDTLYDKLIDFAKRYECKILFVGDIKQLTPVENKNGEKSKSFTGNNVIELTEIFRQKEDNKILPILQTLRDNVITDFKTNINTNKDGGIVIRDSFSKFIDSAVKAFSTDTVKSTKILAFSNNTVSMYNKKIFSKLFPNSDNKFPKGCILTGYRNVKIQGTNIINNSSDYVVLESTKKTKRFKCNVKDVNNFENVTDKYIPLDGYSVKLQEIINGKLIGNAFNVFIHDSSDIKLMSLLCKEHAYRRNVKYEDATLDNSAMFDMEAQIINTHDWRDIDDIKRCECKKALDYGYASTVHKAQGSTYENIFIDVDEICQGTRRLNKETRRELLYTGLSRTKHFAYVLPYVYSKYNINLIKYKLNRVKNNIIIKIKQKYIKH